MTYRYKEHGKPKETNRDGFLGFLVRRLKLEPVVAQNLLLIAESEGKRELFVPAERGTTYRRKLEKALVQVEKFLRDSRNLEQVAKSKAKFQPIETSALTTIRSSLIVQIHPVVDSALAFMRESVGDGLEVTETGLEASGAEVTPESLSGTLSRFCAAKNGVDQSSSLFAWAIGDACNLAVTLGYYRAGLYPAISQVTGIAVNHLKKMAHFSKIIPHSGRIPGWPQSRYQAIVPAIRKMSPKQVNDALALISEGDSTGIALTLREVQKVLDQVGKKQAPVRKSKPPRFLFVTPSGLWAGNRFLRSVALNPRSRVVDLQTLCVLDASQEVLYRIRPACAETGRDKVMGLFGFAFDEEVLEEKAKMSSV